MLLNVAACCCGYRRGCVVDITVVDNTHVDITVVLIVVGALVVVNLLVLFGVVGPCP